MKKIFMSLIIVLIGIIFITGCDANDEDKAGILKTLKKENIIDKDFVLVDYATKTSTSLFLNKTTYYIYENKDSKLIAINYAKDMSDNDNDFIVTIYNDVSLVDVEYIEDATDESNYHTYKDGKISILNRYDFDYDTRKVYKVSKRKTFFSRIKYIIEEQIEQE